MARDEAAQETENQEDSSKACQRRTLTKVEKLNVVEQVKTYSCETLSVVALTAVGHQLPLNAIEELKQFCTSVPVSSLHFLSQQLKKHFIRMYDACSKGADKYLKFQLQWHQHCSYYLVDYNRQLSLIGLHPDDPIAVDVVSVSSQWHHVVMSYSLKKQDAKNFLIIFCSCVYDELLHTCHSAIEVHQETTPSYFEDSNGVYYRFGGASLSSMLHNRYSQIKSCALSLKERVSLEINVLQKLSIHKSEEKIHIPSYLKYRDCGYIYFPCEELMPFLKAVDTATAKSCMDEKFKHEGSKLLTTLAGSIEKDSNLWLLFVNSVLSKVSELKDVNSSCLDGVFKELTRKMCHIRVQEYLDSFKQREAASKGSGTLAGQNLRDALLSHHVNLKTKTQ